MKVFIFIFFYLFVLSSTLSANENKEKGSVAYLTDGLDEIKNKDIRLAFALWTSEIGKNQNVDIETLYYSSHKEIMKDFQNRVFDAFTLSPMFYLQYQESIDPVAGDYYVVQRTQTHYEKMLLLVRKDSSIDSFKDFKNRVVAIKSDSYQARFFFDKEMMEELHKESKGYIKKFKGTKKYTTAVLNVFFKKVDACVVPEYVLKLVSDMNPAVGKALIPIVQSQNIFMPAMTIFHKEAPSHLNQEYKKSISNLDITPRGKNILTLFKMKRIRPIESRELENLRVYYKEYLALKKDIEKR